MTVLLALVGLAACEGRGSDIGPRFLPLPSSSSKVSVFDDANRGVVAARISLVDAGTSAVTGRNGRGELFADPRGRQRLRIDGSAGAAVAGDRLGVLTVAATLSGGDLPTVFHLPDLREAGPVTLDVGTQTGMSILPNPSAVGGDTVVPIGTSVGIGSGAATVTLRAGSLNSNHLPGDLPVGVLLGRGLYIDPPLATFSPGADVSMTNELGASGAVSLYRLDSETGEWVVAGAGMVGGGSLQASGAITTGGLYAFGVPVPTATVSGRIVDLRPNAIPSALINVDGRRATGGGDGRFVVTDVPALDASGADRTGTIEVHAGGGWLPALAGTTVPLRADATIDIGDLTIDTMPAGSVRIQQVRRARSEALRSCRLSSLYGAVALATMSDANGRAVFEDVPSQWFGFQEAFPKDRFAAFYAQAVGFAPVSQRWHDVFQFFDESDWFIGSRSSRVLATDALGGGPLFDAVIVRGSTDDRGFISRTREGGVVFAERSFERRATAVLRTARGGRAITHAFTIDTPNGEHLEMPLQQVLRAPVGAFDRHGLVAGTLVGASPTATHRLRVTRRIELQEWWQEIVEGTAIPFALPVDVDLATTHSTYQAGVDIAGGNVVAAELDTAGAVTLQKLAVAADVVPVEAAVTALDLALDHVAATSYSAPGVLAALDPGIDPTTLQVSLALGQVGGRAIDVVRGLTGNHVATGADLTLALPALAGNLAGLSWNALVQGSFANAGRTVSQYVLLQFDGAGGATTPPLLAPPTIAQPAPSATVLSAGFAVQFALPANVMYGVLELRSTDDANDLLLWQVVLPPTATEFRFTRLPPEASTPLLSGRTYSLTLSAYWSSTGGPFAQAVNPYGNMTTYWQSIGAIERGVEAASSVTIQVTSL